MASRFHPAQLKNRISVSVLALLIVCVFSTPATVYARVDSGNSFPTLASFIETVRDGNANTLRGVYISNVMALVVVPQPVGHPGYVSTDGSVATQFSIASEVGNVGLLAHNTHAGVYFAKINPGDRIILVYGDGHTQAFMARSIQRFQALDPLNPYSLFKDLETQTSLTAEELFNRVYRGDYHLTLQTCIEKDGNSSWGRLFILAVPVNDMATGVIFSEIQGRR